MRIEQRTSLGLVAFAVLTCAIWITGCSESDLRPARTCSPSPEHADRSRPFHTITIDNVNDFNKTNEQLVVSEANAEAGYAAYATWDACALYLGFEGPALGRDGCDVGGDCAPADAAASAYRYLTLYLNIDPLGEDGIDDPKDYGVGRPKLPFHAEYLLELRTDGRTEYPDGEPVYRGNAQLYGARGSWGRGLMQEWTPLQAEDLSIGHDPTTGFVEIAIPKRLIGDPCAIELVGWVVDEQHGAAFGYWPPPLDRPSRKAAREGQSGLALTDSLALDYWGFMLRGGQTPNASLNFNRTNYEAVGDCAYGVMHDA